MFCTDLSVGIAEGIRIPPRHLQHKVTMVSVAALLLRTASNARGSGILTHISTEAKTFCIPLSQCWRCVGLPDRACTFWQRHGRACRGCDGTRAASLLAATRWLSERAVCRPLSLAVERPPPAPLTTSLSLARTIVPV
ncbi:Flavohemoprotein [Giardia duodenalis assemblage B]|uniref:Flavohemoprotein n=1 Tax=Giardia duodenalis assemblage B TaxID=1394984 RepID=A0A132NMT3_GIAIN|nr:Flavohemoprotein [Giardia intestinalis assemblage B]